MTLAFFGLGSNMGDRPACLARAIQRIGRGIGRVTQLSPVYETAPLGYESNSLFLNMVIAAETELDPGQIISEIKLIEQEMGRKRQAGVMADRAIDIDFLLYGGGIVTAEAVIIPHPRMYLRRFVMQPLADIAPDLKHPVLRKTMAQLLLECPDAQPAVPYNLQFTQTH